MNQSSVYGTMGTPAAANIPGGRSDATSWTDASGALWLYGGSGYGNGNYDYLNELWKFNSSSNQWTWMSGITTPNQPGVYGTQGTPAATNTPGGRLDSAAWKDSSGNFWLFGGFGYDAGGSMGETTTSGS